MAPSTPTIADRVKLLRAPAGAEPCVTRLSAPGSERPREPREPPPLPPPPHSWCSTPPAGRALRVPPAAVTPGHRPLIRGVPLEKALRASHRACIAGAILTSSSLTFSPLAHYFRGLAHFFMALRCFQRCCFLRSSLPGTAPFSCTAAPKHTSPSSLSPPLCGKAVGHK